MAMSPGMLTPTYWSPLRPQGITTVHPIKAEKATIEAMMDDENDDDIVEIVEEPQRSSTYGQYLEPPKPHRLMLISPPSSPPIGWTSFEEDGPVINYELIAALASMGNEDEAEVELYPGSDAAPKLVVKCT
ncbi:calcipressin-3-like [Sycon ciliatum]|uniref:calcipressin-3-like n=1 Tax=Sycon ciliatum TaxID=27933 RepID=UPI0031F633E7